MSPAESNDPVAQAARARGIDLTGKRDQPGAVGPFRDAWDALFPPEEAAALRLQAKLLDALTDDVGRDVLTRHVGEHTATALLDDGMNAFDLADLLRMAEAVGLEVAVMARRKAA
jgi:hypothetical protein